MDEPAGDRPVTPTYLAVRDIGAAVDHIRRERHVDKVDLVGWSWGATLGGFYASLHSEKVNRLVMYAPAYAFPLHTNLGPGSSLQDRRHPTSSTTGSAPTGWARRRERQALGGRDPGRGQGQIPRSQRRGRVRRGGARHRPGERQPRPAGATRIQRGARGHLHAGDRASDLERLVYVPVLVIAGEYDTWSYPEDREVLVRDLTNAPEKRSVTVPDATHFVIFERNRFRLYDEVSRFLKE